MAQITQFDLVSDLDKQLVDEFINSSLIQVKKSTISGYKYSLGLFYLRLDDLAIYQAKKVRRKHIVYWLQDLNSRNYAASTKTNHIFHIRMYLSWLFEMKHSRKDPHSLIFKSDIPKLPKMLPRALAPEIDMKLINYLTQSDNVWDKCLLLMRYTGLRLSDLLSLDFNPISDDGNGRPFLRAVSRKLDKQYSIPIDDKTVQLILLLQNHARKTSQQPESSLPSLLVSDPEGREIGPFLRKHLRSISPHVGDVPITPHQLRHTFATSMINAGMGLYGVMKLLGHMDMRMTLRYAELYPTTLHKEFHEAVQNLTNKYEIKRENVAAASEFDPIQTFVDLNHWLRSEIKINDKNRLGIIKRLSRLKIEIEQLLSKNDPQQ